MTRLRQMMSEELVRGELYIDERGFDLGMPHQLHERGQADAGADHVCGEGMPTGAD